MEHPSVLPFRLRVPELRERAANERAAVGDGQRHRREPTPSALIPIGRFRWSGDSSMSYAFPTAATLVPKSPCPCARDRAVAVVGVRLAIHSLRKAPLATAPQSEPQVGQGTQESHPVAVLASLAVPIMRSSGGEQGARAVPRVRVSPRARGGRSPRAAPALTHPRASHDPAPSRASRKWTRVLSCSSSLGICCVAWCYRGASCPRRRAPVRRWCARGPRR